MRPTPALVWLVYPIIITLCGSGCSRKSDAAKPLVTPAVTVTSTSLDPGRLARVEYRFSVAADAPPFGENLIVFVHGVDAAGKMIWNDDHAPVTPTTRWKPGDVIEYSREMLMPSRLPPGPAFLNIGLYSPSSGERVPMAAPTEGGRTYRVADLQIRSSTPAAPVFVDGWNTKEQEQRETEWRWTKGTANLDLPNPGKDATLVLLVDQPAAGLPWTQEVTVRVGTELVEQFRVAAGRREIRRFMIPAAALGTGQLTRITLAVNRPFVPLNVPALQSSDSRELGIRLFAVYFETP